MKFTQSCDGYNKKPAGRKTPMACLRLNSAHFPPISENSSDRTRTCDPGLMNPLLCQLSYAARFVNDFMGKRAAVQPGKIGPAGRLGYWASTLLIVKIGRS